VNILEVKNLVKDYDTYRAVDTVSFDMHRGQVLGLLGPNGAGKSTTIQILLGITLPTSGSISYFGQDFDTHRQPILQRINFASAYNTLNGRLTVNENLTVFAGLYGLDGAKQKIAELLEFFEIGTMGNNIYWDLSAGERTRVNLVKAMLNDPELILMDEPTASLDPDIADKTLSLIEQLRTERGISILFTSHNMAEVSRICDEVIFLDKGKIVSKDTPANHIGQLKGVHVTLRFKGESKKVEDVLVAAKVTHAFSEKQVVDFKTSNKDVAHLIALIQKQVAVIDTEVQKPDLEDVFLDIARRGK
jgi:ABC-2 type transport system ATP-binding protein